MKSSSSIITIKGFMSFPYLKDLCATINWVLTSLGICSQPCLLMNQVMSCVIKTCMSASYDRMKASVALLYILLPHNYLVSSGCSIYTRIYVCVCKPPLPHAFQMNTKSNHCVWTSPR